MVFIPTDGRGYRGKGSEISSGSITGGNMLNTHFYLATTSDKGSSKPAPVPNFCSPVP